MLRSFQTANMTFDLTEEDQQIFTQLIDRGSLDLKRLSSVYTVGDVRDAQLMRALLLTWEYVRERGCTKLEWWAAFREDVRKTSEQGLRWS